MRNHPTINDLDRAAVRLAYLQQAVALGIAQTLTHQFPRAAYLALSIEPDQDGVDTPYLYSVLDGNGATLYDGFTTDSLPDLPDSPTGRRLLAFWGTDHPADPHSLLGVLRELYRLGARFDNLPDDLPDPSAPLYLPCLPLTAQARVLHQHPWETVLRPFDPPELPPRPC